MLLALTITVVVVAVVFDYTNGFHDASNAIATSVSTRALTPRVAVTMAAVMNLVGAFLGQAVAETVAETIEAPSGTQGLIVVLGGLTGAIAWNLITWWLGLPSSSTYALIGGLIGAGLTSSSVVHWGSILDKVVIPMVVSPILGFTIAFALMIGILWLFRRVSPGRAYRGFRLAQSFSASAMALGHGLQDAQKTMGVITLALVTGGFLGSTDGGIPWWVVVTSAVAISLGTYAGGWRIIRTLGRRVIDLDPPRGFAAETTAAGILYTAAYAFQAPISTTQTITSAIMGVGATRRLSAVRWRVASDIAVAWVLTIPMAALLAAVSYWVLNALLG